MSTMMASYSPSNINPIDLMEQIIGNHEWEFERHSDTEIVAAVPGNWCNYILFFSWVQELNALHFSCTLDVRVPNHSRQKLYELLALINDRLWIGYLGICSENNAPIYRHSVLLRGMGSGSVESMEDMIDIAITECERIYPTMQFVIWGGKSPAEAIEATMLDCAGEA